MEEGLPWPYPTPRHTEPSKPSWDCPEGTCVCHPSTGTEAELFHVSLFDEHAVRLPKGRCRIRIGDTFLFDGNANNLGVVAVEVPAHAKHVTVEWVPEHMPTASRYPFRVQYALRPKPVDHDQGIEERLRHLGFRAFPNLLENAQDFQRRYGLAVTNDPLDIGPVLLPFHDAGALPPLAGSTDRLHLLDGDGPSVPPKPLPPTLLPQHGCVASVASQSVAISIQTLFSIQAADITPDDLHFRGQRANVSSSTLLQAYYNGPQPHRQWHPQRRTRVARGTIRLTVDNQFATEAIQDDRDFVVCLPSSSTPGSSRLVRVDVNPDPAQLNPSGRPAGPDLSDASTTADLRFRPFSFTFTIDDQGNLGSDPVLTNPVTPRFVSFRVDRNTSPPTIEVDWRPDWMRAGQIGATPRGNQPKARVPRDFPEGTNPFDPETDATGARVFGKPVIVLHQTSTGSLSTLTGYIQEENPNAPTPAARAARQAFPHYQIDLDGHVVKVCDEHFRAAHAGARSAWELRRHVNNFSVGIEILHDDTAGTPPTGFIGQPFTLEQYQALERLVGELRDAFRVEPYRVIGHHEELLMSLPTGGEALNTERRECPGSNFDWARLEPRHALGAAASPMAATPARPITQHFNMMEGHTGTFQVSPNSHVVVRVAKTLLFDLGYWLTPTPVERDSLDGVYNLALAHAVRAFQTRRFSGRARHYTISPNVGAGGVDEYGTLDPKTLKLLLRVWTKRFD
jgi:N-acetyl-anhydromuramyl-L-alanine amidase AmpD